MKSIFDSEFLEKAGVGNDLGRVLDKIREYALEEIKAGRGCDRSGQTCIVPHLTRNVIDDSMKVQVVKMCDFMRIFGKCAHVLYLEKYAPQHASILCQSMFSIR